MRPAPAIRPSLPAVFLFSRLLPLILLAGGIGCSKQPASSPAASTSQPAPLIHAAADHGSAARYLLESSFNAGGIPTTYRASFEDDQLTRIVETRGSDSAKASRGDYRFKGARLMSYTGASSTGGQIIELEFNLQGGLIAARAGSSEVAAEEISATRTRAQLLRSHALAQRAVRGHGKE